MTKQGIERAATWGWPNIYTYTKSMGDQLVARETGIVRAIVRPAIVESAVAYPFRGWNEGFTTSAPLVYLALKGQNVLPVSPKLILDVVPVDHVVSAMLMVAAQAIVEQPKLVFQLSQRRSQPAAHGSGRHADRPLQAQALPRQGDRATASSTSWRRGWSSAPSPRRTTTGSRSRSSRASRARRPRRWARIRPGWGAGRFTAVIDRVKKGFDEVDRVTSEAAENIELFRPFIFENSYIFRADNIRALRDRMPPEDQAKLIWGPENLDLYDYWMNIHFPGLERWVLPELDETYAARPKQVYSYHDLLELFDTTTKLHAPAPALRIERGGREETYSYADLQELATRVGVFLAVRGVAANERVMLFAKNAPEWSMAYFGTLKAGATSVPVDHESSVAELVNVARASDAVGMLVGDDLLEKNEDGAVARARRGGPRDQAVVVQRGVRAAGSRGRAGARAGAGAPAEPRRAGVADLHLGDDRQAQGGDADPPQLHLHGVGAVEDLRVRRHRRDAVGAAAAPHLRVRDRPAGAAGARRADHLPARADRRRDLVGAQARARDRDRRRPGAVGSAAPAAVPALRRQVARAGRLHARAREGELRAAQPRRLRRRPAAVSPGARGVRRPHPLPHQRRLGAAGARCWRRSRAWASASSRATA